MRQRLPAAYREQSAASERSAAAIRATPPEEPKREEAKQEQRKDYPPWTEADDQNLADTISQWQLAIRRKDRKREKELRERIAELEKRRDASKDDYHL